MDSGRCGYCPHLKPGYEPGASLLGQTPKKSLGFLLPRPGANDLLSVYLEDSVDLNKQELSMLRANPCIRLISGRPKMSGTTAFQSNQTGTAERIAKKTTIKTPLKIRATTSAKSRM